MSRVYEEPQVSKGKKAIQKKAEMAKRLEQAFHKRRYPNSQ